MVKECLASESELIKEVAGVLEKSNIGICAGQESWEKEESNICVEGIIMA